MPVIICGNDSKAHILDKSHFKDENFLQEFIDKNAEAIPIYELEEGKKLFVVKREFSTTSGAIDALAIDQDGGIYVVETKLYRNSDKRKIVAQALDYGAALWKHSVEFNEFVKILSEETQKKFGLSFQEKAMDFFGIDDEQTGLLIESLRGNLNEGNFKFLILMDAVDERLKDLIIYINQNSQFDIYAAQLEYYKFEEYEILVPKVFGAEVKKRLNRYEKLKNGIRNHGIKSWRDYVGQLKFRLSTDLKHARRVNLSVSITHPTEGMSGRPFGCFPTETIRVDCVVLGWAGKLKSVLTNSWHTLLLTMSHAGEILQID